LLATFTTRILNQEKTMAIKKQFLKSKPVCKVTFTVPAEEANSVAVVGDFNEWSTSATELKKLKNGTFKGTVDLETANSYEFRYVIDGTYVNDEQADAYAWNDFAAAENGVLNL
jgi:1,4-alpha-glucan branching enzyme